MENNLEFSNDRRFLPNINDGASNNGILAIGKSSNTNITNISDETEV